MKNVVFLRAIALGMAISSFGSPNAHAETDAVTGHGRRAGGGGKRGGANSGAPKGQDALRGDCSIIVSPSNPFPGPCVNLLLILDGADGNETIKTRTDGRGRFEVSTEPGKSYKIASGSRYYEVVAPTEPARSGTQVRLQLRQK